MKIALGSDHRGAEVREHLAEMLRGDGHGVQLVVVGNSKSCDYPDVAHPVAQMVAQGDADRGILVCGSGIGMSIAANKVHGIRAALVHDEIGAEMSRRHNNANILCLSADMLGMRIIDQIVRKWLSTPFDYGRHARRVQKIAAIEEGRNPLEVTDEPAPAPIAEQR